MHLHHAVTINLLEEGNGTQGNDHASRSDAAGTSSDDRGVATSGSSNRAGRSRASGRAGGGGDERTIITEGAVAKALGVLGSASGHVGTRSAAALVVSLGALLGAVMDGDNRSRASRGRAGRGRTGRGRTGGSRASGSGTSRGRASGRASSRGLERAVIAEGAVAQALSVLGSTGGHVGTRSAAAHVVGISALLGAVVGRGAGLGRSRAVRLADGARAVSDGEGGGLGDGVGLVVVRESGGLRAVGGDGGHDLSGVDGLGGSRLLGASSGSNQRAVVTERAVAQALGVLGGAGSHVGTLGNTALVVSLVAVLSASILGRASGGGLGGLADGAGAVGDGQSARLSDDVVLAAKDEAGGAGAVGGVDVVHLGDGDGTVGRAGGNRDRTRSGGGLGSGEASKGKDDGVLGVHFEGFVGWFL